VAPAMVEIKTLGKKRYSKRIDYVKGHPKNPMTIEDCANKLQRCVSFSALPLKNDNIEKLIELISDIEENDDVTKIVALLS